MVRRYRDRSRQSQLRLDDVEIETLISTALESAFMQPSRAKPVLDLEAFLESGLGVNLDQHASLDRDVLGLTTFVRGQPPLVQINRDLTGAFDAFDSTATDRARWRSTLAHEGAHVIIHRQLFQLDERQGDLFLESEVGAPASQRCFKRAVGFGIGGADPREVQANKGMAALLMPKGLFVSEARSLAARLGLRPGNLTRDAPETRRLVGGLAEIFAVSRQATEIRLQGVGFIGPAGTITLFPVD